MIRVNSNILWLALLWITLFAVLISFVHHFTFQYFNIDEFEHVHTAWKIFQGNEIYIDFFQHHHPFFYYLLQPFIEKFGETTTTLFAIRYMMIFLSVLILAVTYMLALRIFKKPEIAIIAVIFTITLLGYYRKSIEIRPDVPQALFGLLSIYFLFVYYEKKTILSLIGSAVFLCLSFLFLQKAIFLGFIIVLFFLYDLYRGKVTLHNVLLYFSVVLACLLPYYLYLVFTGKFEQYFITNWLVNIYFSENQIGRLKYVLELFIKENIIILAIYTLGLFMMLKNKINKRLALLSIGLLATTVLFLIPGRRHYILIAPIVGMIASYALVNVFNRRWLKFIILLIAISVPVYVMQGKGFFKFNNSHQKTQLEKINYALSVTDKDDKVHDSLLVLNLYREDIDYFWFCVRKNTCLDAYRQLTGYHYDIYELIEEQKPKLIGTKYIKNLDDPRISNYYDIHKKTNTILIRKD